jgi:hypothetical protein
MSRKPRGKHRKTAATCISNTPVPTIQKKSQLGACRCQPEKPSSLVTPGTPPLGRRSTAAAAFPMLPNTTLSEPPGGGAGTSLLEG